VGIIPADGIPDVILWHLSPHQEKEENRPGSACYPLHFPISTTNSVHDSAFTKPP